jgi:hypothetical protein
MDLIFFIIRLSIVSSDISKGVSNTMNFLIPILIFDLIGSVPLIVCDIVYVIMRHCIKPLIHANNSYPWLWRLGTMTCIRLHCHKDRPQGILLMRIIFIVCSFLLRFICFIIAASCSARFSSECTAYAVIAGFGLVSSIFVIIVELVHFFRLWTYNPTETRNSNEGSYAHTVSEETRISKTHRRHLRFIHYSLLNDQTSEGFRYSRCQEKIDCKSQSLHHHLLYHSLETEHEFNFDKSTENEKKSFIAFYETTKNEALLIAQNGFPYGDSIGNVFKDYLHLKKGIFFTRSCSSSTAEAIICVRLNLGRAKTIPSDEFLDLDECFGKTDGTCDTIYVQSTRRFYLRMPSQIEKWIVTINANVYVNDKLDGKIYQPCL